MELEKVFKVLWQNLYKPFVFYIPKRLMPELDGNKALNTVFLIDSQGFDNELKDEFSNHLIQSKSMVLNENIFKLIDINERLKKEQFQFILKKYLEHVNFVFYVSDWMGKHVTEDVKDLRAETKEAFQSQVNVFLKHMEELKSHIIIPNQALPKEGIHVIEFIENDLKEILNFRKNSDSSKGIENKEASIVKPKKKSVLLTDEDAEVFLLESVFGVS